MNNNLKVVCLFTVHCIYLESLYPSNNITIIIFIIISVFFMRFAFE